MKFLNHPLDKKSPIPLYYQLKQAILSEIHDESVSDGDILPTEDKFCTHYGISRTTVRQAIVELVQEGVLYRVKGKGTFVSKPQSPITTNLTCMYSSFISGAQAVDKQAVMCVESAGIVKCSDKIARELGMETNTDILFVERFQKIDGEVFSYIRSYLPYPLCDQVLETEKFGKTSMYQILKERPESAVGHVERHIYAHLAEEDIAVLLKIEKGEPLLVVFNKGYSAKSGKPVIFEEVYYSGSKNKLVVDYDMDKDEY